MKKLLLTIISLVCLTAITYPITVSWDPNTETDLAGYTLHWGTTMGGPYPYSIDVNKVTTYTVSNTNFLFMKKYYMVATAQNTSLLRSDFSNEISFTITNDVKPTIVKAVKIITLKP